MWIGQWMGRVACLLVLAATAAPRASAADAAPANSPASQPAGIVWQKWTPDLFERAKKENRFVLLDLEAVWCHWCHVMEETTYRDPAVVKLMGQRYIAVRVDQDARPDLSNRYEDFGWPATIVFAPDGGEIVKRRGYLPPRQMASMLQAIIDDPTPGPSVGPEAEFRPADGAALPDAVRAKLESQLVELYDEKNAGWGGVHKFIDADVIEFLLSRATGANPPPAGAPAPPLRVLSKEGARRMARGTLAAGRKLIDPAWGGVYQYSTDGDWDHPHFEKIMSYQADDLRAYATAYAAWHDPADLQSARDIRRFLRTFLTSPEGAFFTSQDADLVPGEHAGEYFALDDAARRKQGVPRVDTHVYARENGWAIQGLVSLYAATGDEGALEDAARAARWVLAHRALEGGGFAHGETSAGGGAAEAAGPYLGDTLAMGRAFLALYAATADRAWLDRARGAADFIGRRFPWQPPAPAGAPAAKPPAAGFVTAAGTGMGPHAPKPQVDENVAVARFANLLWAYTGNAEDRRLAESALRYLASPQVTASRNWLVGGLLLADREASTPPPHVTVVGLKGDARAKALYLAALRQPAGYRRVEWFDPREGALPHADVQYPELDAPAAFVCTGNACSAPVTTPAALEKVLSRGRD